MWYTVDRGPFIRYTEEGEAIVITDFDRLENGCTYYLECLGPRSQLIHPENYHRNRGTDFDVVAAVAVARRTTRDQVICNGVVNMGSTYDLAASQTVPIEF